MLFFLLVSVMVIGCFADESRLQRKLGTFDYHEGMPLHPTSQSKKYPVDECDFREREPLSAVRVDATVPQRVSAALLALLMTLGVVFFGFIAPRAHAAETDTNTTITNNITDTQNLLGSDIGEVTDAIDEVKADTGVTLNLLYLPTFDSSQKTETWAGNLLESTKPAENTVMLAVASEDGSLVVVVSKNSATWLKNETVVDDLSEAALGPIVNAKTPDWSGSAIALAEKIKAEKTAQDEMPAQRISIIVLVVVLVALGGFAGFFIMRRLRTQATRRRHAKNRPKESALRGKPGRKKSRHGGKQSAQVSADAQMQTQTDAAQEAATVPDDTAQEATAQNGITPPDESTDNPVDKPTDAVEADAAERKISDLSANAYPLQS